MNKGAKLIIISKSKFCHVPELYANELLINKLNSFSEQLRFEMMNKTEISNTAREYLNKGMNLPREVENTIWQSILSSSDKSKLNVLDLGSSNRLKLIVNLISEDANYSQSKYINLQLKDEEFIRRCEQTLNKGTGLDIESKDAFLKKYQTQESKRQQEILELEKNQIVKFKIFDAVNYEKKIISEQISNSL